MNDKEAGVAGAVLRLVIVAAFLAGLPLLGGWAVPATVEQMAELPPRTQYVGPAPFSWIAFTAYSVFILVCVVPFVVRAARGGLRRQPEPTDEARRRAFPWWGWTGVALGAAAWVLAWTRFPWFALFQRHTFAPLWLAYVLVVNALTYRRTGRCLMLGRPKSFALLFPASAAFWWFFEYLNRFVQNWLYVEVEFSAAEYVLFATLAFSTVLPAVLSTREWLLSFGRFDRVFRSGLPVRFGRPRAAAAAAILIASVALANIGVAPDYLFPFLWVAPLLIIVGVQTLCGERHLFSGVPRGDWRPVVSAALAALVCGCFWELWNYHSLAKWYYAVPFVHAIQIFEMPLLGYAGYLPFGMECVALSELMARPAGDTPAEQR